MRTFNHVGIVTTEQVEGAMFNEGLKVWLTDYSKSPNRIEFLKFEESDRQVFVAYGRAEDHLLAFQLFLQRRNGVGNVSLFLYQFGQTSLLLPVHSVCSRLCS